jgi:transcriptional regulator with XRE-family HTH domain
MGVKNRFLEIRLKLGYKKQKDFADLIKVSQPQYSKYENNKEQPSIDIFYRASKILNIPIDELIYDEES